MKTIKIILVIMLLAISQSFGGELDGGLHLLVSVPLGDFADVSNTGIGLGGKLIYKVESAPWMSLRGDLGYLSYESTERFLGLYSQTIRNEGFQIMIGPQVNFDIGSFKPYIAGLLGFYYYQTVISYPELAYYYGIPASERKESNSCLGWNVGGGVMFDIGLGPLIDIGVRYSNIYGGAVFKQENEPTVKKDAQDITITIGVVFTSKDNL